MAGYSPGAAMREFLRRGGQAHRGPRRAGRAGSRSGAASCSSGTTSTAPCEEVRELLDRAVLEERKQLARDLRRRRDRFAEMRLEKLPPSTAAAVNELSDYEWRSPQAREDYERIKDLLGRELLDQRFAGMKQALENATDEDRAARQRDARATSTTCSRRTAAARTPTRSSATSWTSTATSSPRTRRTSRSCSTRSPRGRPPPSGCSTR